MCCQLKNNYLSSNNLQNKTDNIESQTNLTNEFKHTVIHFLEVGIRYRIL